MCGCFHRRRVILKQFFENMTAYMGTTDTTIRFNNTEFDVPVAKTRKLLLVCVGAVACMVL